MAYLHTPSTGISSALAANENKPIDSPSAVNATEVQKRRQYHAIEEQFAMIEALTVRIKSLEADSQIKSPPPPRPSDLPNSALRGKPTAEHLGLPNDVTKCSADGPHTKAVEAGHLGTFEILPPIPNFNMPPPLPSGWPEFVPSKKQKAKKRRFPPLPVESVACNEPSIPDPASMDFTLPNRIIPDKNNNFCAQDSPQPYLIPGFPPCSTKPWTPPNESSSSSESGSDRTDIEKDIFLPRRAYHYGDVFPHLDLSRRRSKASFVTVAHFERTVYSTYIPATNVDFLNYFWLLQGAEPDAWYTWPSPTTSSEQSQPQTPTKKAKTLSKVMSPSPGAHSCPRVNATRALLSKDVRDTSTCPVCRHPLPSLVRTSMKYYLIVHSIQDADADAFLTYMGDPLPPRRGTHLYSVRTHGSVAAAAADAFYIAAAFGWSTLFICAAPLYVDWKEKGSEIRERLAFQGHAETLADLYAVECDQCRKRVVPVLY